MKPPSKEGSKKWILAQEEFYLNPETANIYDIKFNVKALKKNLAIDRAKFQEMMKSEKQKAYEREKKKI